MDVLAQRFEDSRPHLAAVAYRMLGSRAEADDAVQEAWLRLQRSTADEIENLAAWLTTVVTRICLNVLRSRRIHPDEVHRLNGHFGSEIGIFAETEKIGGSADRAVLRQVASGLPHHPHWATLGRLTPKCSKK